MSSTEDDGPVQEGQHESQDDDDHQYEDHEEQEDEGEEVNAFSDSSSSSCSSSRSINLCSNNEHSTAAAITASTSTNTTAHHRHVPAYALSALARERESERAIRRTTTTALAAATGVNRVLHSGSSSTWRALELRVKELRAAAEAAKARSDKDAEMLGFFRGDDLHLMQQRAKASLDRYRAALRQVRDAQAKLRAPEPAPNASTAWRADDDHPSDNEVSPSEDDGETRCMPYRRPNTSRKHSKQQQQQPSSSSLSTFSSKPRARDDRGSKKPTTITHPPVSAYATAFGKKMKGGKKRPISPRMSYTSSTAGAGKRKHHHHHHDREPFFDVGEHESQTTPSSTWAPRKKEAPSLLLARHRAAHTSTSSFSGASAEARRRLGFESPEEECVTPVYALGASPELYARGASPVADRHASTTATATTTPRQPVPADTSLVRQVQVALLSHARPSSAHSPPPALSALSAPPPAAPSAPPTAPSPAAATTAEAGSKRKRGEENDTSLLLAGNSFTSFSSASPALPPSTKKALHLQSLEWNLSVARGEFEQASARANTLTGLINNTFQPRIDNLEADNARLLDQRARLIKENLELKANANRAIAMHRPAVRLAQHILTKVMPESTCPITKQLFTDPVVLHSHTIERSAVVNWVNTRGSDTHPITRDPLNIANNPQTNVRSLPPTPVSSLPPSLLAQNLAEALEGMQDDIRHVLLCYVRSAATDAQRSERAAEVAFWKLSAGIDVHVVPGAGGAQNEEEEEGQQQEPSGGSV